MNQAPGHILNITGIRQHSTFLHKPTMRFSQFIFLPFLAISAVGASNTGMPGQPSQVLLYKFHK